MRVAGPSALLPPLLGGLDAQTLADLSADLLAVRGHSQIRITDGPGDGGRDIHSHDSRGRKHLTQCKHHGNTAGTVSSSEIGQLPLAMVRLGYTHGLFVTDARISPQSKREFLDNYKELSLDFLEGSELVGEALRDLLLRAIWFDGKRIDRVATSISFPVLIRDLERDKPIAPSSHVGRGRATRCASSTKDNEEVEYRFELARSSTSEFAPYRPPGVKTMGEGWWSTIDCGEFIVTGLQRLGDLHSLRQRLVRTIVRDAARGGITRQHVAVRVGRPWITSLRGANRGSRIGLKLKPQTFVSHAGAVSAEYEWLLPPVGPDWYPPARLSALIADWVRWYSPTSDVCLDINLISIPSERTKGTVSEQQAFERKRWATSVFALVNRQQATGFRDAGVPLPTESHAWNADQVFGCWFIGSDLPFRQLLVEPADDDGQTETSLFGNDLEAKCGFRDELTKQLVDFGAEIIEPQKARHIYAIVASDPLPDTEEALYRSVDLMHETSDVPSPIDPSARRFRLVVCWRLEDTDSGKWTDHIRSDLIDICMSYRECFEARVVYDSPTKHHTYLVIYLSRIAPVGQEASALVANGTLDMARPILNRVEQELAKWYPFCRRATREFWEGEIGVLFDLPTGTS